MALNRLEPVSYTHLSAAVFATWQLMDHITETYNIDMNRIYGSGQSMGGMQVLAMAAQRDNYFAAILPISCTVSYTHLEPIPKS